MLPIFVLPVYAEPSEGDPVGWIEVQCSVPDDFHDSITVVISEDATGEIYSVDCREINGYIGRAELPVGTYTIFQVDAAQDRPAGCDISTFEITADMKAAQLIRVTVESATGAVLKDEPENLDDDEPNKDNTSSSTDGDKADVDEVTPESPSKTPASAPGHTFGIIVAVCIIAVIVVVGFVVYMRKRR